MELCRSHDSNFGVSKSGIEYLMLSKSCSRFFAGDCCSHWACIVFKMPDRDAVVRSCV